jgi:hypothetical protein
MGRHTDILEKLSGCEEYFGIRSSKEISLVNESVAMALLLEVILHHFQHICRKIKGHKAGLEIEYLFYTIQQHSQVS